MTSLLFTLKYSVWMAWQAWSMLRYNWHLTSILVVAFIVASVFNFPFLRSRFRQSHLVVLAPLVVSLLILLWGSIMRHEDYQTSAPSWPDHIVTALLVVQVLTGIVSIWAMKGYRWFAFAAVLLEEWFGWACALIAGMSVTGDWL